MQGFKFQSYIEFYEYLTEDHKVVVDTLKGIIQDTIPDIKEKLSWNVPFFYRHQTICYIWPGSVPWGKKTRPGVELGFTKGYLMAPNAFLERKSRKQVYLKTFQHLDEIIDNTGLTIELLKEASALDKKSRKT